MDSKTSGNSAYCLSRLVSTCSSSRCSGGTNGCPNCGQNGHYSPTVSLEWCCAFCISILEIGLARCGPRPPCRVDWPSAAEHSTQEPRSLYQAISAQCDYRSNLTSTPWTELFSHILDFTPGLSTFTLAWFSPSLSYRPLWARATQGRMSPDSLTCSTNSPV